MASINGTIRTNCRNHVIYVVQNDDGSFQVMTPTLLRLSSKYSSASGAHTVASNWSRESMSYNIAPTSEELAQLSTLCDSLAIEMPSVL